MRGIILEATPKLVCKVDILPVLVSTCKLRPVANTGGFSALSLGIPRFPVLPIFANPVICRLPLASYWNWFVSTFKLISKSFVISPLGSVTLVSTTLIPSPKLFLSGILSLLLILLLTSFNLSEAFISSCSNM